MGQGNEGLIDLTAGDVVPEWLKGGGIVIGTAALKPEGVGARLKRKLGIAKAAPRSR